MSSHDADARILEQFLRTMAPPAALTATYRHRVVLASLEARSKVLQQRRLRRMVLASSLCVGLIAGSICLGVFAVISQEGIVAQAPADVLAPPLMSAKPPAVDGYESALIQSQLPMRVQTWAAAHRGIAP